MYAGQLLQSFRADSTGTVWVVKKNTFAKLLARAAHLTTAQAADKIDQLVCRILTDVRRGQTVSIPGIGEFKQEGKPKLQKGEIHAA
jgi:nucleoid DNA-binding protein